MIADGTILYGDFFVCQPGVPPKTVTPPHIADIYQNKTGGEGEDVMMTCEATGSPGPRLSWLKKIDDGYRSVQVCYIQ